MENWPAKLQACMQQVQEALKERAQRIYKEYGNVMLNTEGMTKVRFSVGAVPGSACPWAVSERRAHPRCAVTPAEAR